LPSKKSMLLCSRFPSNRKKRRKERKRNEKTKQGERGKEKDRKSTERWRRRRRACRECASVVGVIDFMSTTDDGSGRWKKGLSYDAGHPNQVGHQAMFAAVPLTLFPPRGETARSEKTVENEGLATKAE